MKREQKVLRGRLGLLVLVYKKSKTEGRRERQRCQGNANQIEDMAPAWWSGTDK